jgi:hypothetical protein
MRVTWTILAKLATYDIGKLTRIAVRQSPSLIVVKSWFSTLVSTVMLAVSKTICFRVRGRLPGRLLFVRTSRYREAVWHSPLLNVRFLVRPTLVGLRPSWAEGNRSGIIQR